MTLRESLTEWAAPLTTESESPATDNVLEALIGARKTIAKKRNWTKNSVHRQINFHAFGRVLHEHHSYCLLGAVINTHVRGSRAKAVALLEKEIRSLYGYSSIEAFNDSSRTTHEDVLTVLDLTIQARRLAGA